MEIFIIQENQVIPHPQTLLIPEFNIIWKKDKTKTKNKALKVFAFIEFYCSPKKNNPFHGYKTEDRPLKINEFIFKNKSDFIEIDSDIRNCINFYNEFLNNASISMQYYNAVKEGVHKMIDFYKNLDLNERNERGQLVFKINDVSNSIIKANDLLKSVESLKAKVEQEIYESVKTKGGKEINPFER